MEIPLKVNTEREAVATYIDVLHSFHRLTDKEMETLVEVIMSFRTLLLKYDESVANSLYLNKANREVMLKKLKMKNQTFKNYLSLFRKKGIVTDNGISKTFLQDYDNVTIVINICNEGKG
jgi:hypothetical protein